MIRREIACAVAVAVVLGGAWSVVARGGDEGLAPEGTAPDVIVGVLLTIQNDSAVGQVQAYTVGTTSCNIGNATLDWFALPNNGHPVIGGNLYQVKDGRLRQIGYSWLKHGFTALAQNACGLGCQNPGTGSQLGIGCSDPYSASLNAGRPMGRRIDINATRGYFPVGVARPDCASTGEPVGQCTSIKQRLQAHRDDLTTGNGERYFYEAQYVTADDAMAGNGLNNASYREVAVNAATYALSYAGGSSLVQMLPAIYAWQTVDPHVHIDAVSFQTTGGPGPATGDRFPALPDPPELLHVGTRIHDEGKNGYRWEIAVHNLNSHRSVRSVSVPIPPNTTVHEIGFHDVNAHSGEELVLSTTDWMRPSAPFTTGAGGGTVVWSTETFDENPNANAIRWGMTYSFWVRTSTPPPRDSQITLGLFRTPGSPTSVTADMFGVFFEDGFESGDTTAWSATAP